MKHDTRKMARQHLDRVLQTFPPQAGTVRPHTGWIRAIRQALGMTATQLARRMGIRQPSVTSLELSEQRHTITLASLEKAADSLDCDLVYALVPRRSLDSQVRERARVKAEADLNRAGHSMALENQSVNDATRSVMLEDQIEAWIRSGNSRLWDDEP